MHVWQWLFTGLVAGAFARLVIRDSQLGLAADLALGSLGGLATGALLRYGGLTAPDQGVLHVAVALLGAVGTIAAMHAAVHATRHAHRLVRGAISPRDLGSLDELERRVLGKFVSRETVSHDVEREHAEAATLGQRVADRIASFGGSWAFIGLFAAVLVTWMLYNLESTQPFDAFPFILLNLLLSCLAAVQAPIILMSQNRQSEKDRLHAAADYEVNLKAELEILALHEKLDALRERAWEDLLELQQRQLELLERIERTSARPAQ